MIDKSTFCTRPWNELHIEEDGHVTPCCVMPSTMGFRPKKGIKNYLNSPELAKLKEDLKNGIKSEHCKTCWMQEGYGTHSHRKTTLAKGEKLDKIEAIHVRSTNVCNFKCRICSPDLSSAWQAENKKHNLYKQKYFQSSITDIHDNLLDDDEYCKELFTLLKSVRQINMSGGEPLTCNTTLKFFERCREYNITNTNIAINSNLSKLHYKNHYWLDEFKDFRVTITVSWDGFGKQMEYHRTGLNWKKSLQNFKESLPFIYNVNCVLSIYSIYSIPKLIHFCDRIQKDLEINLIAGKGGIMCVQTLPEHEKDKIKKHYENSFSERPDLKEIAWDKVINPLYKESGKEYLNTAFKQYNQILDKQRGTSFVETFPELKNWWESIA